MARQDTKMLTSVLICLLCLHTACGLDLNVGLFIPSDIVGSISDSKTLDVVLTIMERFHLVVMHNVNAEKDYDQLLTKLQNRNAGFRSVISSGIVRPGNLFPQSVAIFYRNPISKVSPLSIDRSGVVYSTVGVKSDSENYHFVYADIDVPRTHYLQQLNALPAVYKRIVEASGLKDVLFAGNFLTGLPYVSKQEFQDLTVTKDKSFAWYISYDTNDVAEPGFNAAFARLLGAGGIVAEALPKSATVYNFNQMKPLTVKESGEISPYYPIGLNLHLRRNQGDLE